ncbi:MAG: class I SAM-dependent methyltransferase [Chloroflexota bacterium]
MSDISVSDELHRRTREIWDANAAFWDGRFGEGNDFHLTLIAPATERLLNVQPGEQVLDVGCGNGAFARRLAALGCRVVACDFSQAFLACARARTVEHQERIAYRYLDATDAAQLDTLGAGRYDAIVSNMVLMDISAIEPLLHAVPRLLRPGGRFVFAVMHPCFSTPPDMRLVAEQQERDGELVTTRWVQVSRYLTPSAYHGLGMIGQPEPQYYFHRPLCVLLGSAFQAGLVMDGIAEPAFGPEHASPRSLSWGNYHEIPPALVVRLRPG